MADNGLPALPAGFTLDAAPASDNSGLPPLPAGFTLDKAQSDPTGGAYDTVVGGNERVAGLTGRSLIEGVGQLEDTPRNVGHAVDAAAVWLLKRAGAISQDYQLPTPDEAIAQAKKDHPVLTAIAAHAPTMGFSNPFADHSASEGATATANALNLPTAATPAERIYSSAVRAAPTAALAPEALPAVLPAMTGGAAAQTTAELGGGPVAQTIAGLVGGGYPVIGAVGSGLVRTATRGAGADAAAAMQQRIADAQANGAQLTAGQAGGGAIMKGAERVSAAMWGGGPLQRAAEAQREALSGSVDNIVDNLRQGAEVSPTTAGSAIQKDLGLRGKFMDMAEKMAYGDVDAAIPAGTTIPLSETQAALKQLTTPTAGAEASTGSLVSPKIAQLAQDIQTDLTNNGGQMPYTAVRALRTRVGAQLSALSPDQATNGALKQVYGALSQDLKTGASAVSPEAATAAQQADALYRANSAQREIMDKIVDNAGGPEAVYNAMLSGKNSGATKINQVMTAMVDPESRNLLRATVINRLGQNAQGEFNAGTFLGNWGKMSGEAKDALFGKPGQAAEEPMFEEGAERNAQSLRSALDSLTTTMGNMKGSVALRPTTQLEGLGAHAGAGLAGSTEAILAIMLGHPAAAAGAVAIPAANNLFARAVTNPRIVRWLAQTTKLPKSAMPNAINQLANLGKANNDPDAVQLAAALQQASQQ
jgi:hypothetical protein